MRGWKSPDAVRSLSHGPRCDSAGCFPPPPSVRLRRLGFGFPGGRSFGEDEDELNVPRPGEVGEVGAGDAWRVTGEGGCGCGRMVCHCARLFWLFGRVSRSLVPAPSRTPRTCSRVDVDSR